MVETLIHRDSPATRRESLWGALSRRCLSFSAGNVQSVSALCRIGDSIPPWREFQGDSDRFPKTPILSWSLSVLELRHGLSPARSRRPHGRPAEAGRRLSARNLYPAARQGAVQGARLPHPLSQGRLHERSRKLARTARRRHRIHDATAAQRRLARGLFRFDRIETGPAGGRSYSSGSPSNLRLERLMK